MLTRSLGTENAEPDIGRHVLHPHQRWLLCTDGLTKYLDESGVAAPVAGGRTGEAVARLIRFANDQGGCDNVGVVVIDWADTLNS